MLLKHSQEEGKRPVGRPRVRPLKDPDAPKGLPGRPRTKPPKDPNEPKRPVGRPRLHDVEILDPNEVAEEEILTPKEVAPYVPSVRDDEPRYRLMPRQQTPDEERRGPGRPRKMFPTEVEKPYNPKDDAFDTGRDDGRELAKKEISRMSLDDIDDPIDYLDHLLDTNQIDLPPFKSKHVLSFYLDGLEDGFEEAIVFMEKGLWSIPEYTEKRYKSLEEDIDQFLNSPQRYRKSSRRKRALFIQVPSLEGLEGAELDKTILRLSVIAELDATSLYEQFALKTKNEKIKKILLNVAKEEKTHVGEFQALLKEIDVEQATELETGAQEVTQKASSRLRMVARALLI